MTTKKKEQEKTQETMDNPHQFGPWFREWRELRGLSLKEAAGDIISVSHLSQFEQGNKAISLVKLSELLISIGVDWTDFMLEYPGLKFTSFLSYNTDRDKEKLKQLYQNYPQYQEQLAFFMERVDYAHQLSHKMPNPLPKTLINQMLEKTELNNLEGQLLIDSLSYNHLTKDEASQVAFIFLSRLKAETAIPNFNLTSVTNHLISLTIAIRHLSRMREFTTTYKLIAETRKALSQIHSNFYPFLKHDINLDCFEVFTLLREGRKTEAFTKKNKLNKLFDAIIDYNFNPSETEYYTTTKAQFNLSYHQLVQGLID